MLVGRRSRSQASGDTAPETVQCFREGELLAAVAAHISSASGRGIDRWQLRAERGQVATELSMPPRTFQSCEAVDPGIVVVESKQVALPLGTERPERTRSRPAAHEIAFTSLPPAASSAAPSSV